MRRGTAAAFSLAAALLAGATFLWLLQGTGRQGHAAGPPQMPPPLVAVSFAALQPIEVTARTTGTVEAAESITVTSPVTGVVQRLRFADGQQVAQGAPLVELDAKAQLGALAAAQTELKDAHRNLRRLQRLVGSGAVSRAALDTAEARVDTAQARVNQARGDLSDRRITAPFAGTIGLSSVSVGAVVQPGDPVATLATTGRLKLAFRVPEKVLAQLRPGLPVRATVQAFDRPFTGTVTRIDNAVDSATRSIAVEALLDDPGGLRPGLFASIELVLDRRHDVAVPEGSVVLEGEHAYVFTVGDDHVARRQEVTIGERRNGMAEVREGLAPGTRIVTAGVQKVQPDKPVMASAEVIDREVTEIIEEQVSGIEGIRNINSTSRDDVSAVSIEFTLARNLDAAAADGRLFTEFGIALAAAVGISGIVALTIGAMLSSRLVETGRSDNRLYRAFENGFDALARSYVRALTRTLGHPLWVLLVAVVISAVAVFVFRAMPRELAPLEDRGFIIIPVQAPEGATFNYTRDVVNRINGILEPRMGADGPVSGVLAIVAPSRQGPAPVSQAFVIVRLKPWDERNQKQQAVAAQLLPPLFMLPEARAFAVNPPSLGQAGFAEPVQVAIGGPDYANAARYGAQLLRAVAGVPGLLNPRIDYNERAPQLRLQLDRERAADLGIDARQVGGTLQAMFGGFEVTDFIQGSQLYKVLLEAERDASASPDDVNDVWLRSRTGQLVPLSSVVTMQETGTAPELVRVNRSPSVTLKGTLAPGAAFGDVISTIDGIARETLPSEARLTFLGEAQTYQESQGSIALFFGLALLIVYLVLAAQFESFIHPVVIMVAVPLAFTGGLLALMLTGHTLSIYGQVGLVLLIGLVAKNGILLVDFANQFRDAGGDERSAAIEAGRVRLRPVLMTSIATLFGAVPLALASGPGAEGRIAIGIAVIGGLALSTLLTLFVVPTFYAAVARYTRPGGLLARRLREEESAEERRL